MISYTQPDEEWGHVTLTVSRLFPAIAFETRAYNTATESNGRVLMCSSPKRLMKMTLGSCVRPSGASNDVDENL